ncbi:hypothetical protein [Hymenobacter elongatus]|uniref:Uncharacterized protein n=1 Tax=Hymenobacter elongatus TaxID=877208 RepID=A0A4Z0PRZ2_9BACT|nr:hypothetical protein [Hymenobacter elongatus]TGE20089.1 hypothetical protein E5J99_00530 [Hymenobacter elongatus]
MKKQPQMCYRLIGVLWAAVLLGGAGCKKAEELVAIKLPEATQEGKQTFGCLVDDKVWTPYTDHLLDDKMEATYSTTSFRLSAEQEDDNFQTRFDFDLTQPVIQPGTYAVGSGFKATYGDMKEAYTASSGSITITKVGQGSSTINNSTTYFTIVAGTFTFTATSLNGKTIRVKDGRFDARAK